MGRIIAMKPDQRLVSAALLLPRSLYDAFVKAVIEWYDETDEYYQVIDELERAIDEYHDRHTYYERCNERIAKLLREYDEFADAQYDYAIMREANSLRDQSRGGK